MGKRRPEDLALVLLPPDYAAEPADQPSLKLVWVTEIDSYAVVRFFVDRSGEMTIRPISYSRSGPAAERRMHDYARALAAGLRTSRTDGAETPISVY